MFNTPNVLRSLGSPPHLLLTAVGRLRPLGGAAERSAVVAEVTGGVHLVLWGGGRVGINAARWAWTREAVASHLQDVELVGVDLAPGLLQPGHGTHVHPSWKHNTGSSERKRRRALVLTALGARRARHSLTMAMSELKLPMLKHS